MRAGDRAVVDHPLVEVGPAGRAGQRLVAAHPREHAWLELGDVGDHEGPAVVGDCGGPDLHRERQRTPAVGRPPPRGRAGRLVGRAEPAVAHPLVDPRPAVGREEVRGLLVVQQRPDARVLQHAQRGRPRVLDVQPGPPQCGQQLGAGVGVEPGCREGLAHPAREGLELDRPGATGRAWAQPVLEQALVHVDAPGHPGVGHLGCDQGARRLRGQQQPEPHRVSRARDRCQLAGVLEVGPEVLGVRRSRTAPGPPAHSARAGPSAPTPPPAVTPRPLMVRAGAGGGPGAGHGTAARARPRPAAVDTTAPCRPTPSAARHASRSRTYAAQVARRELGGLPGLDHQHPFPRQSRERDPGHGHMLSARDAMMCPCHQMPRACWTPARPGSGRARSSRSWGRTGGSSHERSAHCRATATSTCWWTNATC